MIATVYPPSAPLSGEIDPPSSKNFTTRYILASCLASGKSVVRRPAIQDDAAALIRCGRAMGAEIIALDAEGREVEYTAESQNQVDRLEIYGFGPTPRLQNPGDVLNPGNAGAVFRMLLAISALMPEARWETHYPESLGKRPHIDLIEALRQLGVEVDYAESDGRLPITLKGGRERIKKYIAAKRKEMRLSEDEPYFITVSGEVSSQYTSALLLLAPLLDEEIEIRATGRLKSLPLIETTRNVLSRAGIHVESSSARHIHRVRRGQAYAPRTWETNGDWPGAAAILAAAAAVPESKITVLRLFPDEQGERECVPFFEKMGCRAQWHPRPGAGEVLEFESPAEPLRGASVNGDLCTDAVLAMEAAAMVAQGESRFVQIRNLQFKECDRVREPIEELRNIRETALPPEEGVEEAVAVRRAIWFEPEDDPDTIHINGAPQGFDGGLDTDGRGDHRVIMMLSIIALRCRKGLRIHGAEHVSKSFPGWFATLEKMGVRVEFVE